MKLPEIAIKTEWRAIKNGKRPVGWITVLIEQVGKT